MKKFMLEELCTACYNLDYEEVSKILKEPLSKTIINQSWSSDDKSYPAPPLVVALISGVESKSKNTIKIVKALIRNGADVNITIKLPDQTLKQPASMSPLMIMMWYTNCDIEIVKLLIQNGADMNFKNEYGMNPLYWAICNPNGEDRAKFLISAGADIDIQVNEDKIKGAGVLNSLVIGGVAVTPLQLASKLGKTDIVRELLLNGANTKIKNGYGWDALQLAKQNENDEICKLLSKTSILDIEISGESFSEENKNKKGELSNLIEKNFFNHEESILRINENINLKNSNNEEKIDSNNKSKSKSKSDSENHSSGQLIPQNLISPFHEKNKNNNTNTNNIIFQKSLSENTHHINNNNNNNNNNHINTNLSNNNLSFHSHNNDSFSNLLQKVESLPTEEIPYKDFLQLKELLLLLKQQAQKKDDIILNLRQQIKQLNKTLQEKDMIVQKNNDTVSLVFHVLNDNLKPQRN